MSIGCCSAIRQYIWLTYIFYYIIIHTINFEKSLYCFTDDLGFMCFTRAQHEKSFAQTWINMRG